MFEFLKKDLTKSIVILLIIISINQLLEYLVLQHYDYRYKHEGINPSGLATIETALMLIDTFCIFLFATPKKWLEEYGFACALPSFMLSVVIMFVIAIHSNNLLNATIKDALSDSYSVIGFIIHKKEERRGRGSIDYYIWTGINDTTTSRQNVNKREYESLNIGDTVILQVSCQYPRINKVLNWTPTNKEIEELVEVK